jgi:NAD(P)-dependent dehydrogenase (short-subunit alcohol dehydrogenase family)
MDDKLAVVTGPTSGIGKEIATQLARMGARVVLACRDLHKGEATLAEIAQKTQSKRLSVLELDTSSQSSVRDFAERFERSYTRLDLLINNAGVNLRTRRKSVDGIELVFATNVLGYYLVTLELLGLLKAGSPARIVNVASTFAGDLDLDDLEFERRPYHPIKAYRQSKACDRLLTWALARRLGDGGVTVNAMAPGLVQTGLYRETAVPLRLMLALVGLFKGRSVGEGADTAVWLGTSPEVNGVSGRFFEQRKEIPCEFRNEQNEERLFEICEQRIAGSPLDEQI